MLEARCGTAVIKSSVSLSRALARNGVPTLSILVGRGGLD